MKVVEQMLSRYAREEDEPGTCVLKEMVAPGFTEGDRQAIEAAYRDKVGEEVRFIVQLVDDIPLTARGKLKMLDSRVSPG